VLLGLPGCRATEVATVLSSRLGSPGSGGTEQPTVRDLEGLRRHLAASASVMAVEVDLLADGDARSILRAEATVVWLDGDEATLATADPVPDRPMAERRDLRRRWLGPLTVSADAIVSIGPDDRPETIGDAVERRLAERASATDLFVERVELDGGRSYPVVVGRGVLADVASHLPERAKRVAIVTQAGIGIELQTGRDQEVFLVPDGEGAKVLDEVGRLTSAFAQWGLTRADCVVSIGGGVVSDLAGFVAASYHRGIPVVHAPTTLLGQIDAAIGGKCGVNLPEGKNLVGAFWQPQAVICDVDTLATLPARQFGAGMGELAKYHFLGGGQLDRLELVDRVARSVAIKADVVSGDEREGGRRAILNYGHTLAHALETIGGYGTILHGEAVAIGLIYAAELAASLGRIDRHRVDEHRRVVAAYGLDIELPSGLDHDEIIDLFARDKKAIDGVTFVLDGPDGVEPLPVGDRELLGRALAAIEPVAGGAPAGQEAAEVAR
ncbi:MAG: 3-dehydroquinate synthase family protein, partial [Actinomycetota bacterium]